MFPDLAPHGVARGTHAKVRIVWGHKYLSLRLNFAARMTSPLNCIMFSSPAKGKGGYGAETGSHMTYDIRVATNKGLPQFYSNT